MLSGEDKVVIGFSLLGLFGSVALYFLKAPSLMISMFLSAGITALVYRFLGGIQGAKFTLGALKLGGTIAALIGVAYWMNSTEQFNPKFHLASNDDIVGEWEWEVVGPSAAWDGHLDFKKVDGQLVFTGKEYNVEKAGEGTNRTLLFEITNGKAALTHGNSLSLESDVVDHQFNRSFHWKSIAPFVLTPGFQGWLRPQKPDDPNLESNPWGMLIYKKSAGH